ncbi:CaiB/BaiF CoA transferase family protein [Nocardioides sp. Bht2]|uniref:CaiB/BaiF CoA transferase family protein n=1 Tax=Nocardioides sp. Bht2 TaxID=3392297 RepID=UPI0039B53FFE
MSEQTGQPESPLAGLRVVEFAGMGPAPFAAMLLSDMGADVIRIDSPLQSEDLRWRAERNPINRGRRAVVLDLKEAEGRAAAEELIASADVVLEGFRPGVMERLGLDPDRLVQEYPRVVIGRMSGWGQDGPEHAAACHDINILAISGLLDTIGTAHSGPVAPPMYLADFAGGGLVFTYGVLCALMERERSGRGQIVDASMAEGTSLLSLVVRGLMTRGDWAGPRGTNELDTGAPYYRTYETADGRHLAVGAIEPQFYTALVTTLGLAEAELPDRAVKENWPQLRALFGERFAARDLAEWTTLFTGVDACVAPVLRMGEVTEHPQFVAREAFVNVDGIVQPAPTPRLSRTPGRVQRGMPAHGEHTEEILGARV